MNRDLKENITNITKWGSQQQKKLGDPRRSGMRVSWEPSSSSIQWSGGTVITSSQLCSNHRDDHTSSHKYKWHGTKNTLWLLPGGGWAKQQPVGRNGVYFRICPQPCPFEIPEWVLWELGIILEDSSCHLNITGKQHSFKEMTKDTACPNGLAGFLTAVTTCSSQICQGEGKYFKLKDLIA